MVWSKLADEVLDHPKVARAGVIGWAVWSASIVWSNRNLTDGHIPRTAARRLLDLSDLMAEVLALVRAPSGIVDKAARETSDLPPVRVDEIATRLVECGLWEAVEDGWRIHDFLDHNPSREQVEAARRAKAEAGRVGASRRWGMAHAIGAAMAPAKHLPKQNDGRAIAETVAKRWQNDAPDPDPDPRKEEEHTPLPLSGSGAPPASPASHADDDGKGIPKGSEKGSPKPLRKPLGQAPSSPFKPLGGPSRVSLEDVRRVFAHWQAAMGHPKARLDGKRERRIRAAVGLYGVAQCLRAIDGCAASPYHMGENPSGTRYDDVELILRDAAHVERFVGLAESPPVSRSDGGARVLEMGPPKIPANVLPRAEIAAAFGRLAALPPVRLPIDPPADPTPTPASEDRGA